MASEGDLAFLVTKISNHADKLLYDVSNDAKFINASTDLHRAIGIVEATIACKDAGIKTKQHGLPYPKAKLCSLLIKHELGTLPKKFYEPTWKDRLKTRVWIVLAWSGTGA